VRPPSGGAGTRCGGTTSAAGGRDTAAQALEEEPSSSTAKAVNEQLRDALPTDGRKLAVDVLRKIAC
jgi:hypothetical protein